MASKEGWDGWATNPIGTQDSSRAMAKLTTEGEVDGIPRGSKVNGGPSSTLRSDRVKLDYEDPDGGGGSMELIVRWHCGGEISWSIVSHERRVMKGADEESAPVVNVEEASGNRRFGQDRRVENGWGSRHRRPVQPVNVRY